MIVYEQCSSISEGKLRRFKNQDQTSRLILQCLSRKLSIKQHQSQMLKRSYLLQMRMVLHHQCMCRRNHSLMMHCLSLTYMRSQRLNMCRLWQWNSQKSSSTQQTRSFLLLKTLLQSLNSYQ
ncbi:hypothetical protein FGO68_gene10643 [Halteria grandinella]|uniref:Uncharacterized protein n=1 Tax=Halteria grandinella TaxID=5974 RepID=A0A8J8SX66_HALGN|nr:hypothetical protein FGO68_gene10643 [Halteria grandinella]